MYMNLSPNYIHSARTMSTSTLLYLTAILLAPSSSSPAPLHQQSNSTGLNRRPICPFPRCANPDRPSPQNPCGSCEFSQCKYEGCVHFGMFPVWKPDNCTMCYCDRNTSRCIAESCQPATCYGYPKVRRPNTCCEECDYDADLGECKLVPKDAIEVLYANDHLQTCRLLLLHKCDKSYAVDEENNWYRCTEVGGKARVSDNEGCEHITGEEYEDSVVCRRELITDDRALPHDYDPNPTCLPLPSE